MKKLIELTRRMLGMRFGIGAFVLGLVAGGTVMASHDFSDVPDTHVFHTHISQIVNAGITTGCAAGLYCPDNAVTRGQMAAFLTRTGGRTGFSSTLITASSSGDGIFKTIAEKQVVVPGAGTATQFVTVRGAVNYSGSPGGCPCNFNTRILEVETGAVTSAGLFRARLMGGQFDQDLVHREWSFAAPAGATRTYRFQVALFDATSAMTYSGPTLIVNTTPFGATGGNTLGPDMEAVEAAVSVDGALQ